MNEFADKVVLVTGAGSGIGRATSILFAKKGAKLCLVDKNEQGLQETKQSCGSESSNKIFTLQVDLTNFDELSTVVDKTIKTFNRLDVLLNIAGAAKVEQFGEISLKNYQLQMNTNLRAPFFLCQYAIPHLEKTKGCIVNMSSCASLAVVNNGILTPYSVTKSALDHFCRCLSAICSPKGIRVNNINPSVVDTPIYDSAFPDEETKLNAMSALLKTQPLGLIPAENIAKIVLQFASNDSKYITGVTLPVDAGFLHFT